jgi:hypothetical protein
LDYRIDWSTVALSSVLGILALTVTFRLFTFCDVKSDRYSTVTMPIFPSKRAKGWIVIWMDIFKANESLGII